MNSKRFCWAFFIVVILSLSSMVVYNMHNENTGIINDDFSGTRGDFNQRFVKIRYLLNNKDKYDAYVFGSSRANQLLIDKRESDYKYYNLSYTGGLPEEFAEDIKTMARHGVQMKQIIIALDDISYAKDTSDLQDLLHVHYKEDNTQTYKDLFQFKLLRFPQKMDTAGFVHDIENTGRFFNDGNETDLEREIKENTHEAKFTSVLTAARGNNIPAAINAMGEIKEITDANGIELIVLINPVNQVTYMDDNLEDMLDFKAKLAEITDYYDFCYLSSITTNNNNYYETSHYCRAIGDVILNRIFDMPKEANTEYCVYVTKDNIQQHLAFCRSNREAAVAK